MLQLYALFARMPNEYLNGITISSRNVNIAVSIIIIIIKTSVDSICLRHLLHMVYNTNNLSTKVVSALLSHFCQTIWHMFFSEQISYRIFFYCRINFCVSKHDWPQHSIEKQKFDCKSRFAARPKLPSWRWWHPRIGKHLLFSIYRCLQ